jgi:hypothetical protein
MPPLIQKWNILKDEDKDLFPLLEVSVLVIWPSESYEMVLKVLSFEMFTGRNIIISVQRSLIR